jgi:ubiquinone/menaquinone biosynthesis C-methylase UbiE
LLYRAGAHRFCDVVQHRVSTEKVQRLRKRHNLDAFRTSEFDQWGHIAPLSGLSPQEQHLIDLLDRKSVVLEVGCGGGRIVKGLKDRGFGRIVALDFVFGFLQLTKSTMPRVVNADARQLPLAARSFDHVIAFQQLISLIETKSGRQEFLRECYRVMRPQGLLLLTALSFADTSLLRKGVNQMLHFLRGAAIYRVKEDRLLPWLRKGGKPNWRFLLPDEPLTYWYLLDELREDMEKVGFRVLDLQSEDGLLWVVAEQPEKPN